MESFHGTRNQTHHSLTCVFLLGHYFPNRKLHVSNSILRPYKLELWMSLTKSTSRSSHLQQYPEPVHPVEYSAELPGPPVLSKIIFNVSSILTNLTNCLQVLEVNLIKLKNEIFFLKLFYRFFLKNFKYSNSFENVTFLRIIF